MAGSALELRDWFKRFGKTEVLRGLSLKVEAGEWLTLLGPSGCGKTTVLRCLAGFEKPDAGEALLGDRDLLALPPQQRPVHTVFQHYALFPHLTVFENVAFGLRVKGTGSLEVKRQVLAMLERVRMQEFTSRSPAQLSGGQQQRVALARALVMKPQVLLLDEPLGALDAALRRSMQIELKTLQRELGLTCILVTHDQDEALRISDRIAVMHAGKVAQIGSPRELYASPRTAFVAGFLGLANLLPVTVLKTGEQGEIRHGQATWTRPVPNGDASRLKLCLRPEELRLHVSDRPLQAPSSQEAFPGPALEGGVSKPGPAMAFGPSFAVRLLALAFEGETWRATVALGELQFEVAVPAKNVVGDALPAMGSELALSFAPSAGCLVSENA